LNTQSHPGRSWAPQSGRVRAQAEARGEGSPARPVAESGGVVNPGTQESLVAQNQAEGDQRDQQALLESATVEQTYQSTLTFYVQAKHEQAEALEDRIEHLIENQEARLQQMQNRQPGIFSRPSTRQAWQAGQSAQKARLQTLHGRLDAYAFQEYRGNGDPQNEN
jgi:hypothetical protein